MGHVVGQARTARRHRAYRLRAAGLLLTHGPLAVLGVTPSNELIKGFAEFTLALVLFSDASRVGWHELRADAGWYARLLGIAALGAGMMVNPLVPARIRRLVNVESGLNDGIATPFVSVALAGAAAGGHLAGLRP